MANWSVGEWSAFFGLVTAIVASIAASIVSVIKATQASTKADTNSQAISDVKADVNTRTTNLQSAVNVAQQSANTALLHTKPPVQP